MLTRDAFESDPAYLEYLACREVWPRRDEGTPNSKGKLTWSDWYRRKFGRSIEEARREYIAMQAE